MLFVYLVPLVWLFAEAHKNSALKSHRKSLRLGYSTETFDAGQELHILADFDTSANLSHSETSDAEIEYGPEHRAAVLEGCGQVCDSSIKGTPGKYFNEIHKQIDCEGLYSNTLNDAPAKMWPPPKIIPASMYQDYTMNGTATVEDWYWKQRYSGGQTHNNVWTEKMVNQQMEQAGKGQLHGTYGVDHTNRLYRFIQKHADKIHGKHFFVIGSETPWVEAILLQLGAEHVTTIEYGRLQSEHPRITTKTPQEIRQIFLASGGKEPKFDGGITFSSIEHSGLGRYGDTLNPWGDIQAIAKAWCITRDSGSMFVGVPSVESDIVTWNAHRQYGPTRWSQLMTNWLQLDREVGAEHPTYNPGYTYMFEKMP